VLAVAAVVVAGCGGMAHARHRAPRPRHTTAAWLLDPATAATKQVPSGPREAPVPILMYHVIAPAPARAAEAGLWVPPSLFARQVRALARGGYHATTLDAVWRAWHGNGTMPRHPIVLSFDDGYQSQATVARRMLDRLGWPGVLNLVVKHVGIAGGLSRAEVRSLMGHGWEIDAHTISHGDLTTLDASRLRHEVAGSRSWLRRAFGAPADFFCYPAGRYNAVVEAAVRAAGYEGATTTNFGEASRNDDPYALPRIRVTPQTTAGDLVSLVRRLSPA